LSPREIQDLSYEQVEAQALSLITNRQKILSDGIIQAGSGYVPEFYLHLSTFFTVLPLGMRMLPMPDPSVSHLENFPDKSLQSVRPEVPGW